MKLLFWKITVPNSIDLSGIFVPFTIIPAIFPLFIPNLTRSQGQCSINLRFLVYK